MKKLFLLFLTYAFCANHDTNQIIQHTNQQKQIGQYIPLKIQKITGQISQNIKNEFNKKYSDKNTKKIIDVECNLIEFLNQIKIIIIIKYKKHRKKITLNHHLSKNSHWKHDKLLISKIAKAIFIHAQAIITK